MFERDSRQQQAVLPAALNHQTVLASRGHGVDAIFPPSLDGLRRVEQPNFDIEKRDFSRGHDGKTRVAKDRAFGSVGKRSPKRNRVLPESAGAGAEVLVAFETDENSRDRQVGGSFKLRFIDPRRSIRRRGGDPFRGGCEQALFLLD